MAIKEKNKDVIVLLLKSGCRRNQKNKRILTPCDLANEEGYEEYVDILASINNKRRATEQDGGRQPKRIKIEKK